MKPELPLFWRVIAGAFFGFIGVYLLGLGFGVLDATPGDITAPLWLVALAGAVFALCAVMIGFGLLVSEERLRAAPPLFRLASRAAILAFLILLAIAFSWLAFSPDADPFSASMAASGAVRGEAPEGEARLAFGGMAVLSYVLIAATLVRAWRS